MSPKQQRFVVEYLIDLNATQAAIRAGYSPRAADRQGHENLRKPEIAAAVAEAQRQQHKRLLLTADETREQNAFIARLDPADMFDANGALLHIKEMPRHVRCALKSLKVVRKNLASGDGVIDTTLEVQFWDKGAAIAREYQHFGLLVEKIDVNVTAEVNVIHARLNAARGRMAAAKANALPDAAATEDPKGEGVTS